MTAQPTYTDEQLIARYLQIRDAKAVLVKQQAEALVPYDNGMAAIADAMLQRLNERSAASSKTEAGTAYKKLSASATVEDRDAFLDYVRKHDAWGLLTNHVSKEQVEAIIETTGSPPSGVKTSSVIKVHFRKG
jgi:hypothetical protein